MPERPDPLTNAEIAAVLDRYAEQTRDHLFQVLAALDPGRNVKDMPAESVTFGTREVQPGGARLLVPALESRTRVQIIAAAAGVFITAEEGVPAGASTTMELGAGVPLRLHTRAAIYACVADGEDPVSVALAFEHNRYGLA